MTSTSKQRVGGILLLYDKPTLPWEGTYADNVTENIAAVGRHSRFRVWPYNVEYGFRPALRDLDFDAIVLHYSVFIPKEDYMLGPEMVEWVAAAPSYKVAFFQDEHHHCGARFEFIDRVGVNCVYSMLEEPYGSQVYGDRPSVSSVVSHYPSYVGNELVAAASAYARPEQMREIDIGYRGRPMPSYMGRGAQEKAMIGERFAELAGDSGLILDIATREEDRIYAQDWHRFTGNSKGTLGTESGVSCFDLEDEVREEYDALAADGEPPSVEELERGALGRWDGRIPYRTVSPRNFEAAAFRTCQILFEGEYSGVLEPMRHYIPLRKDFENIDEAIERFKDADVRRELTENAFNDLIASGDYSYEKLIAGFDANLIDAGAMEAGFNSAGVPTGEKAATTALHRSRGERWERYRDTRLVWLWLNHRILWWLASFALHPIKVSGQYFFRLVGTLDLRRRLGLRSR